MPEAKELPLLNPYQLGIQQGGAAERERCAKICEEVAEGKYGDLPFEETAEQMCARLIRSNL